jgi:serine/threonine protein kinase
MHLTIPGYKIIEKLGQGGMGAVFKAKQLSLDRFVALKILPPKFSKDEQFVKRFLRESKSAGKINHPYIVSVYDCGFSDPYYYFSMEYVSGKTLKQVFKDTGPIPEIVAIEYLKKLAIGLHFIHSKDIIHRDIKPENIILDHFDNPKLADLGLARSLNGDSDITLEGKFLGTPAYVSPEQASGQKLDGRSDLYSLGATFYLLLTGVPVFDSEIASALLVKHVTELPKNLTDHNPKLSKNINNIIIKLLQKNPDDRYQSGQDLYDDLDKIDSKTIFLPYKKIKKNFNYYLLSLWVIIISLLMIIGYIQFYLSHSIPVVEVVPQLIENTEKNDNNEVLFQHAIIFKTNNPIKFNKINELLLIAKKYNEHSSILPNIIKELTDNELNKQKFIKDSHKIITDNLNNFLNIHDYDAAIAVINKNMNDYIKDTLESYIKIVDDHFNKYFNNLIDTCKTSKNISIIENNLKLIDDIKYISKMEENKGLIDNIKYNLQTIKNNEIHLKTIELNNFISKIMPVLLSLNVQTCNTIIDNTIMNYPDNEIVKNNFKEIVINYEKLKQYKLNYFKLSSEVSFDTNNRGIITGILSSVNDTEIIISVKIEKATIKTSVQWDDLTDIQINTIYDSYKCENDYDYISLIIYNINIKNIDKAKLLLNNIKNNTLQSIFKSIIP